MAFMGYVSENLNKFNTTSERRGRDYFYQGAVKSLSFDGTNASAIVSGTSEYSVSANFDGHRLKSWSCSCPYSFGGACKHVVALLCALDDRESSLGRQKGASRDKAREHRDYVEASNLVQDAFAYGGYVNTYQIRRLLVCFRDNAELTKAFITSFLNGLLSSKGSYYFSSDLTFFFECFKNSKLPYPLFPSSRNASRFGLRVFGANVPVKIIRRIIHKNLYVGRICDNTFVFRQINKERTRAPGYAVFRGQLRSENFISSTPAFSNSSRLNSSG